ncbi:PKD domain-containing protein, partial [Nocardioides psychrotolerans]|uniref:PKD domain-containing protein n=1 Tax=Nocardioides psychrotolerans TaxID=1005945 RepID=UPI0011BED48D
PPPRRSRRATALIATGAVALAGLAALAGTAAAVAPASVGPALGAPSGAIAAPPGEGTLGTVRVENSFVSSVGWVKPGETYPSRVVLTNTGTAPVLNAAVTVASPRGTTIVGARPPAGSTASVPGGGTDSLTWTVPTIPAGTANAPSVLTLVLEHTADTLAQEPTLVWRDLSSRATLTTGTSSSSVSATSHGPKVIPPNEIYETARYGDRPFPVVPVQYTDRAYQADNSGEELEKVINDPAYPGSTFNLFQEMSLGQLFPEGTVPSAGKATADFPAGISEEFTGVEAGQTCTGGVTFADSPAPAEGTPLYPERITEGVYNLPGNTEYYGADANGSALVGALAGVGSLQNIDSGCGSAGKLVYDAAVIADPEIDYSDYDTDKDGVVDFFMAVFAGCGGNGASQLSVAGCEYTDRPYDNVWPHSSSLEFYYTDPTTGLTGYTTDDQLKDLEGRRLWYTDTTRTDMTTTDKGDALKVFVRVGPYNVNPETAIDAASVISHEYGHSLGLPDFYSTGSRETYGDWNLMATDKSQNMDAFSRQELGWVVPQVLDSSRAVTGWKDSKQDTDSITWTTADGTPYTLTEGADGRVQNSQMYVAKLPGRQLLDAKVFDSGDKASKTHAWWSGSGNDFGCAPAAGRNLDVALPQLAALPTGSTVTLSLKSWWDIEWDYDYGYVLTTVDGGKNYTSNASEKGYTTSNTDPLAGNPNQNTCQAAYDNGLTGTSGSYQAGSEAVDRKAGNTPDAVFLADEYDISELAGKKDGALRFSYATDPGLARPGWFIDDLKITVTEPGKPAYDVLVTDLEADGDPGDPRFYNGGCKEDLTTAQRCTLGWKYLRAGAASEQDHAYYLEMRDRSGFDFDGLGQADRGAPAFEAGLSLVYTDEAHGYGNAGTDDPPAQSPLDSVPQPGSSTPNLNDAAFKAGGARSTFSDAKTKPHVDNYEDPSTTSGNWEFAYDCLGLKVDRMAGDDAAAVGNLTGDVTFTMGSGCGEFNYGYVADPPSPPNTAPTARATATPATVAAGEQVTLSALGSTDAETPDALDFSWDLGNGGTDKDAVGRVVRATYTGPGTKTARVTVTDPQGLTSTATVAITVTPDAPGNQAPDARMQINPKQSYVSTRMTLSGLASSDAETSSEDLSYAWDFGDGGVNVDATSATVRTTFTRAGYRTVRLTVTDAAGRSDTATQRVLVRRATGCWSRSVEHSGSWRRVSTPRASQGDYCDNLGKGKGPDVLRTTFRGPQVDVFHGRAAGGGSAIVYIDGKRRGTVSFAGSGSRPVLRHHEVFRGLGEGSHTLRLVATGRAWMEGFITIR